MFCKLFPEYVERAEQERLERAAANARNGSGANHGNSVTSSSSQQMALRQAMDGLIDIPPIAATLAGAVAILSIVVMFCRFL